MISAKKKGGKTQKERAGGSNDDDNADDEDNEGRAGGAASRTKKSQRKENVTIVHLEKYGIELPTSTKKLIEKRAEKHICCCNGHRMRAGPFVDTNKRTKTSGKQKNLNSKTKPADGSKNDSDDEEVALTAAVADSDEMHSNDDFAEEKEGENESGFLYPPLKIQQLQREMIEQKHSKVKIVCICCAKEVSAKFIECH